MLGLLTWHLPKTVYAWVEPCVVVSLGVVASWLVALVEGTWIAGLDGLARGAAFGLALCLSLSLVIGFAHGVFLKSSLDLIVIGGAFGLAQGNAFALAWGKRSDTNVEWHQALWQVTSVVLCLFVLLFLAAYAGAVVQTGNARALPSRYVAYGAIMVLGIVCVFGLIYFRVLLQPVYAIASLATYLWARARPDQAARIWRWNPAAWHEVIWIPLPFAGRLLSLVAKHDREKGLEQIRFVQAERPHQRRAAQAALVPVILEDLRCSDLDGIGSVAARLEWTRDVRNGLPREVVEAIPKLDHVSAEVRQFLELQNPYRKRGTIERVLEDLNGLQANLTSKPGRIVSELSSVVNEWERLIKSEHERVTEAVKGQGIIIPFVYGHPIGESDQNLFVGRKDIMSRLEGASLARSTPRRCCYTVPGGWVSRACCGNCLVYSVRTSLRRWSTARILRCPKVAAQCLGRLSRAIAEGLRRRSVLVDPLGADALREGPFDAYGQWLEHGRRENRRGGAGTPLPRRV